MNSGCYENDISKILISVKATYWAVAGWRAHRSKRLEAARLRRAAFRSENDNDAGMSAPMARPTGKDTGA